MKNVGDAGFSRKRGVNVGSGPPLPDPGTMINWFTLIKKLIQTSIVIVSGSIINASTVQLNGI